MSLEQKYYSLLSLSSNATVNDIKKAYRSKAKELHPDRNPSANAEEEFIELQEAYEYLTAVKSGKRKPQADKQVQDFEKWWHAQEARRRQKARKQAKMRYEEYINSKEYKLTESFDHVVNIFFALISLTILVVNPILGYVYGGGVGIFVSVLVILMTLPLTLPVVTQLKKLKLSVTSFGASLKTLFTYPWLKDMFEARWPLLFLLVPINLTIIFKISINTLLPTYTIVAVYALAIVISLFLANTRALRHKKFTQLFALGFATLAVNLLFLLNYVVSFNPVTESYFFNQTSELNRRRGKMEKTSFIILQDNKYEQYKGLRLFMSDRELAGNNHISYTFKTGVLGFRVMTDYELKHIDRDTDF